MAGGFQIVNNQGGFDAVQKLMKYPVASTHSTLLAPGDVVKLTGSGNTFGEAYVDAAAAGGVVTGILSSVETDYSDLDQTWLPASTGGYVFVNVATDAIYKAQIATAALTVANIGQNVDIVATEATVAGGMSQSNMKIDGSTAGTGADVQFRIVGLIPADDGTAIGAVGNYAYVRLNEATEAPNSVGV